MNKLLATLAASLFAIGAFAADTMPAAAPADAASAPAKTPHKKAPHHHKKAAPAPAEAASK